MKVTIDLVEVKRGGGMLAAEVSRRRGALETAWKEQAPDGAQPRTL